VVAEAMVALVLADAALEKFGGDSVGETRRNWESYLADIAGRGLALGALSDETVRAEASSR
jgi:chorismate synthase